MMTDLEWAARNLKKWHTDTDKLLVVSTQRDDFRFPMNTTDGITYHQWLAKRQELGLVPEPDPVQPATEHLPMTDLKWAAMNIADWHSDTTRLLVVAASREDHWFPIPTATTTGGITHADWKAERVRLGLLPTPALLQPNSKLSTATQLLDACKAVQEQRGNEYQKTSERSFSTVTEAFNTITGKDLKPSDITFILVLLKAVRQYSNPDRLHEDSVLDLISYSSLWGEELYKEHNKNTLE